MENKFKIFTINPGSTSTKIALFENDKTVFSANVDHDAAKLKEFKEISEQYPYRKQTIDDELAKAGVSLEGIDACVSLCGGLIPMEGGVYEINDLLLKDSLAGRSTRHPNNLGGKLACDFAAPYGARAFTCNPPDTDEFEEIARVTGFSEITRESKDHPLNQKEVAHRYAASIGKRYEEVDLVVAHMGGGVSVSTHKQGRIVDSVNCIDGDGPMAPTRAGALAAVAIVKMCFSGKFTEKELYDRITKTGGFVDHLGTSDAREIAKRIDQGDTYAKLIYDALIYQIGKHIGAHAAVLNGKVDAILLTGGMANDKYLTDGITKMGKFIAPVKVYPGEFEMEGLAAGAIRVLSGREKAKTYTGEPIWNGFQGKTK